MSIVANKNTPKSQDLTLPPLSPIAAVLHDAFLTTHCSTCFSPLPPKTNTFPPFYCSVTCSDLDSPLHSSSVESHVLHQSKPSTWHDTDTSDLRLSLRLLHIFRKPQENGETFPSLVNNGKILLGLERIAGLMTNRENLMKNDESVSRRIRDGAKAMAMCLGLERDEFVEMEMVLCLVMTNAVEVVQCGDGRGIGIAVYGTEFSLINHSCQPNASYRFLTGLENVENGSGDGNGMCRYGPRVIVRSIKDIGKGEEVTIAYTDLMQPKDIRQEELWLKYKFECCCKRCNAVPATRVDCLLQAICTTSLDSSSMIHHHEYCEEDEIEKLMEDFDNAIADYLSFNNPELCCEKLDNLLTHGNSRNLKLHIFHHGSLNAYTSLTSAYKVRSNDLLALNKLQAFNMSKLSAAYSLLLAGVSHHLFMFESSLIASASNFWINAGESLLSLSRTFLRDLEPSFPFIGNCRECFLAKILESMSADGNFEDVNLEELNRQQLNCAASLSSRIWSMLSSESSFLKLIQNPIDFCWVESAESFAISDGFSEENGFEQVRNVDIINLSHHCLRYGEFLSGICYGTKCTSEVPIIN